MPSFKTSDSTWYSPPYLQRQSHEDVRIHDQALLNGPPPSVPVLQLQDQIQQRQQESQEAESCEGVVAAPGAAEEGNDEPGGDFDGD